ncbi:hypothetical protein PanWU01x14_329770 [Parasponia andersonii]|uniref:Uncharacterized protein n=1 Tax=Parasponia andersonii TaxID=3476 RepID=A0A2P5AID0_PARAD|nr:hypothetical protein PanWU01x14_329770 [Parasponia andersonii]
MKMETEVVRLDYPCNAQGRIKGQKIPGMEWNCFATTTSPTKVLCLIDKLLK